MMRTIRQKITSLCGIVLLSVLAGCSTTGQKDNGLADSVLESPLRIELDDVGSQGGQDKARCGNEPTYTLKGRQYNVLASAKGYQEEGMASWYGAEYQGSPTAGCETFDMHAFTAAHRTLPLPSVVRVTNLQNKKSVLVRVNDRGPFDGGGLIQLSFAAANTLGMTSGSRVAKVRVEAVAGSNVIPKPRAVSSAGKRRATGRRALNQPNALQAAEIKRAKQRGKSFYVVVKNYQDQGEALEMFVRLTSVGLNKTEMASALNKGRKVHQVRVGPLYTQDQIDNVKDTLASNGLATFKVVEVDQ